MRYLLSVLVLAAVLSASTYQSAPISFVGHSVRALSANPQARRYHDVARLTLHVNNNTDERITGWRAWLRFYDPFGDQLFRIQLTSGTADIAPGAIQEATFEFEDNQFIDDEPYDYLTNYSADNIRIETDSVRVVH